MYRSSPELLSPDGQGGRKRDLMFFSSELQRSMVGCCQSMEDLKLNFQFCQVSISYLIRCRSAISSGPDLVSLSYQVLEQVYQSNLFLVGKKLLLAYKIYKLS